jgi:hypothetical protein
VDIPLAKQESSVRHLQTLYTIVAGLALSDAIGWLFREDRLGGQSVWDLAPMLVAFVVTLVPFYHGALRHLDDNYLIDQSAHEVKATSLAVDFVFLFLESCLLFVLAHLIDRTDIFLLLFLGLLVVDIVWAVVFHVTSPTSRRATTELALLFTSKDKHLGAQLKWTANNLMFVVIGGAAGAIFVWGGDVASEWERVVIMIVAVLRTINDYRISWDFYFPPARQGQSVQGLLPFANLHSSRPVPRRTDPARDQEETLASVSL